MRKRKNEQKSGESAPTNQSGNHTMVRVYPNLGTLAAAAAEFISENLQIALREKDEVAFVLSGGRTPEPVYAHLASDPGIDWRRIHFFWGDERCVPPSSPESNFGMAWTSLLAAISVPDANIHRIPGELEDPNRAALIYAAELQKWSREGRIPEMDLVLLGLGEDGHTASLFPGTRWDEQRLVVSNYVPKLSSTRITMTPRLLNAARRIVFLVSGKSKAATLAKVLEGSMGEYPVGKVRPERGSLFWLVDQAAASALTSPPHHVIPDQS